MVNLGTCLEQEGDLAAAGALYARATDSHPELAEAPLDLGILRAVTGDRAGAWAALEEAVARSPTLGTAHYHLALLDDRGRDPAAVTSLRRLLARADSATTIGRRSALPWRADWIVSVITTMPLPHSTAPTRSAGGCHPSTGGPTVIWSAT